MLRIFIFLTCFFVTIQTIFASCENLCCKYILCVIVKDAASFETLANIQHGRNCPTLVNTLPSKIRYVVNPNYANILQAIVKCEICGGKEVDLLDKKCQAYCCIKEGYILDKKYRILHSLSCELLAKHYDINWCLFKKKTYKLFALKEIEFVAACDKCLEHEKRLQ